MIFTFLFRFFVTFANFYFYLLRFTHIIQFSENVNHQNTINQIAVLDAMIALMHIYIEILKLEDGILAAQQSESLTLKALTTRLPHNL